MNEILSARRLWLLLRADFIVGYRHLIAVGGALAAAIFVASVATGGDFAFGRVFYRECFGLSLFIWGIVASSRAFRPLHAKARNEAWLLVPASALEKTLARLLAVTIGLVAFLLVFIALLSLVVETINLLLFGDRNAFFDPFDPAVGDRIALYIFLQSFFFLGGAWFRRGHFVKTTLALALALAAFATLALVAVRVAFTGSGMDIGDALFVLEQLESAQGIGMETALHAIALLLPLACWGTAWLRVREAQVSDGV